jgi:hypothetical protein
MSRLLMLSAFHGRLIRAAAAFALVAATALSAFAAGPQSLVNHQPVVYPNGGASITLNLDQGPLGTRSNAQAIAIVQNAIALWNGVSTSTMRLAIGASLSTDYTVSNYSGVYQRYTDGLNPVIFDTDGSITDALFGAGAKANILGFAGSAYYTSGPSAGKYAEGQAVLNGSISISDAVWTTVLAHEIGHFFRPRSFATRQHAGARAQQLRVDVPDRVSIADVAARRRRRGGHRVVPDGGRRCRLWSIERHIHDLGRSTDPRCEHLGQGSSDRKSV